MTRLALLPGLDGTGELFASFIAALEGQPVKIIAVRKFMRERVDAGQQV